MLLMNVTLGSDHAGFELKRILRDHLEQNGHHVTDVGTTSTQPVDYPDYAELVAASVLRGESERGILICGSGVGASVAANKVPGIRAGLCHDCYSAHQGVEHDNINLLVLGARVTGTELAKDLSLTFLKAQFTKEERHQRRLKKILNIEQRYAPGSQAKEKIS
jgi:ribose 5-phosphate isomerase B